MLNIFDEIGSDHSMFESSYLYMRDISEYIDGTGNSNIGMEDSNFTRINVWVINEEEMGHMLPKILKPEDLEYTYAIIMPDLETPWNLIN